jgi:hypothetical protein
MEQPGEPQAVVAEAVEAAVEAVEAVQEECPKAPRAPNKAPRAKAPRRTKVISELPAQQPAPVIDASFWSSMLQTKREMDRQAKTSRYANLVKL